MVLGTMKGRTLCMGPFPTNSLFSMVLESMLLFFGEYMDVTFLFFIFLKNYSCEK